MESVTKPNELPLLSRTHRSILAFTGVAWLLPIALNRLFPRDLDGFPLEAQRVAVRHKYERRVETLPPMWKRLAQVVVPDNFRTSCALVALYLSVVQVKIDRESIPLATYSVLFGSLAIHVIREMLYKFACPVLRQSPNTVVYGKYLSQFAPSDVRPLWDNPGD